MSREDFCRCTPSEFSAIVERWREGRDARSREEWERGRFIASVMLAPWSKRGVTPRDIYIFPWEKETWADTSSPEVPKGTSSKEVFDSLLKELGRK